MQAYRGRPWRRVHSGGRQDTFLNDFHLYFAKLFDGVPHDLGDPLLRGGRAIVNYARLRIDPRAKCLVFSDASTMPRQIALYRHFADRVCPSRSLTGFLFAEGMIVR